MRNNRCAIRLFGTVLCCTLMSIAMTAGVVHAAEDAVADAVANAAGIRGQVWASENGAELRRLRNDAPIYAGSRVITGRNARVTLRFIDESELTLASRTIINVDAFRYVAQAPADGSDDSIMQTSIVSGVVRALTGLLAKRRPASVRFTTPSATIGVRGTHFATEVEGEQVTVVLLAQDDATTANAVEVANQQGAVEVNQTDFGTVVANANTAPSPVRRMQINTVNRLLRNVQTTRRVIVPRVPGP